MGTRTTNDRIKITLNPDTWTYHVVIGGIATAALARWADIAEGKKAQIRFGFDYNGFNLQLDVHNGRGEWQDSIGELGLTDKFGIARFYYADNRAEELIRAIQEIAGTLIDVDETVLEATINDLYDHAASLEAAE